LFALFTCMGVVAACANTTSGQPFASLSPAGAQPSTDNPTPQGQPSTAIGTSAGQDQMPSTSSPVTAGNELPGTSTTVDNGNALPVDQPCSLVPQSTLAQIGESAPPSPDMVGTAYDCSLETPDFSIGVAIRMDVGLAGFTADGGIVHDLTIGRHQAKQEVDNMGSCVIGIGVSQSSRVDVTVTSGGTADPRHTAMTLATAIEPELP
jgi:hypothetical protein